MNITFCDDEENIRVYIKKLIETQDADSRIMEFSSGGDLLQLFDNLCGLYIVLLRM